MPCTRLHSEEAEGQTEAAQWQQEGLYAHGSPPARVPGARVKADGMWTGGEEGDIQPHKLPFQTLSTFHLHFDVTGLVGTQEKGQKETPGH